ncbi:MAG: hypothetical protein HYZ92_03940 [Candidatus Omnitrophica bacterium]|nr:hypothetical protein [Candidatus Omnitrophota bacterium]
MSVIEEALRQGQIEIQTQTESTPSATFESADAAEERVRRLQVPVTANRWVAWMGISVGLCVLGMAALSVALRPFNFPTPPPVSPPSPQAVSLAAAAPAAANPVVEPAKPAPAPMPLIILRREPPPLKPPELKLNGVVQGVGEPFAIINGAIVHLGESVAGATLLDVDENSARLRWKDQELRLRTLQ